MGEKTDASKRGGHANTRGTSNTSKTEKREKQMLQSGVVMRTLMELLILQKRKEEKTDASKRGGHANTSGTSKSKRERKQMLQSGVVMRAMVKLLQLETKSIFGCEENWIITILSCARIKLMEGSDA
ncbi:hypothetical protein K1719_002433 [Acacia pycnantha]|nr:hypothetical protein K1719_002433 [Acacia pycnantha]